MGQIPLLRSKLRTDSIIEHLKKDNTITQNNDKWNSKESYRIINNIIKEYILTKNEAISSNTRKANKKFNKLKLWITMAKTSKVDLCSSTKVRHSKPKGSNIKIKDDDYHSENSNNSSDIDDTEIQENNLDIKHYNNYVIEKGVNNYYHQYVYKFLKEIDKGVPQCFQSICWYVLNNIPSNRSKPLYKKYLKADISEEVNKQILKDINRSFPSYSTEEEKFLKEDCLYKVLKAFINLDKSLSYCQGINLVIAFILLETERNELDSFYLLIALFGQNFFLDKNDFQKIITKKSSFEFIEDYLEKIGTVYIHRFSVRGLYSEGFPLLMLMNYLFDSHFKYYCPKLDEYLKQFGLSIFDVYISKWFQTLFVIALPIQYVEELWNHIFSKGIFIMINFAIALLLEIQSTLLKFVDEGEINVYFNKMTQHKLTNDASFFDDNNINMKDIFKKMIKMKMYYKFYIQELLKNNRSEIENLSNNILDNFIWYDLSEEENVENLCENNDLFIEEENNKKLNFRGKRKKSDDKKNKIENKENIAFDILNKYNFFKLKEQIPIAPTFFNESIKNNIQTTTYREEYFDEKVEYLQLNEKFGKRDAYNFVSDENQIPDLVVKSEVDSAMKKYELHPSIKNLNVNSFNFDN